MGVNIALILGDFSPTAELALPPTTPIERYFGFTHTADAQHPGHLAAFATLMLVGEPTPVDSAGS